MSWCLSRRTEWCARTGVGPQVLLDRGGTCRWPARPDVLCCSFFREIGVGTRNLTSPLPPNRTGGLPASGSPVSGLIENWPLWLGLRLRRLARGRRSKHLAIADLLAPGRLCLRFALAAIGGSSDFAHYSQSRQSHMAVSSLCRRARLRSSSTDYLFTSSCSPRRVAGTQLLSVVRREAPPERDFHPRCALAPKRTSARVFRRFGFLAWSAASKLTR